MPLLQREGIWRKQLNLIKPRILEALKCPHCFGRGRVVEGDYELTEDTYKEVYEEEQAIAEAERIIQST